ncbi:MAG: hypothetical protein ACD_46C00479G0002 [uncultured bacterium]|nr:MAG: hypothetical protein ACD_46C00479G0002 [uncultured bacterium]
MLRASIRSFRKDIQIKCNPHQACHNVIYQYYEKLLIEIQIRLTISISLITLQLLDELLYKDENLRLFKELYISIYIAHLS